MTVAGIRDLLINDPALEPIADKVLEERRLSMEDGMTLFGTRDVPAVARLADLVRQRRVGDKAYFVHSLRLSQTNVCYVGCTFCGFQRRFDEEGVWDMELDDVWDYVDRHITPTSPRSTSRPATTRSGPGSTTSIWCVASRSVTRGSR